MDQGDAEDGGQPSLPEPTEIQAVSRSAQILALFEPGTEEITPAFAANRLGLNRTTAYRYCTSLAAAGLLERGRLPGAWVPGALLLQLGAYALARRRVLELAPPHMRELASASHKTTVLSLWGSGGPVVFRVEEDITQTVLVTVRAGTHLRLDSAQAIVWMAFHSDQLMVDRLLSRLRGNERERMLVRIDRVRQDGFAVAVTADGVVAIGAPVFDEYGICATLALIGTTNTLSADSDGPAQEMLCATARALTAEMGGRFQAPDDLSGAPESEEPKHRSVPDTRSRQREGDVA